MHGLEGGMENWRYGDYIAFDLRLSESTSSCRGNCAVISIELIESAGRVTDIRRLHGRTHGITIDLAQYYYTTDDTASHTILLD